MIKNSMKVAMFLFLFASAAFATWQIPDVVIYEGKEYSIFNDILTPYFKKYPERDPKDEDYFCSASWRGYKALFEISNRELKLKDIFKNPCERSTVSALKQVVPDGKPLVIDWYSGVVVSMDGENSGDSYDMEFINTFEAYSFFELENGRLTQVKHFDNKGFRQFRKEQFEKYKETSDYQEEIKRRTANGRQSIEAASESIEFWLPFSLKRIL